METKSGRLRLAAGALQVLGALGMLFSMLPGLMYFSDEFAEIRSNASSINDAAEMVGYYIGLGIVFGAMIVPGWLISGLSLLTGWQLRNQRWRGMGIFMAILVMLPCVWNCGFMGFIVGPWLLIVLLDVDVAVLFSGGVDQRASNAHRQTERGQERDELEDGYGVSRNPYESPRSDNKFY